MVIVVDEKTEAEYFSSIDANIIKEKLLKNNYNNALVVGYKFEIDNVELEILRIAIPEIVSPKINNVNTFAKLYVKKV